MNQEYSPPMIDLVKVSKVYPPDIHAISDLSLTVGKNEIVFLTGASGAGKTTLLRLIGRMEKPTKGMVDVAGMDVGQLSERDIHLFRRKVGIIPQDFQLLAERTVAENIALGREPSLGLRGSISHRRILEQSAEDARRVNIDLPMERKVAELTVGDQQLTEIVKAVSRNARVLVMDEPTARLSPTERHRLFDIIRQLSHSGVGIIYISHFLEEIFAIVSRVTVLRDGHRVVSQPLAGMTVTDLARLMVGEKFREIEVDTRANLAAKHEGATPALTVENLEIEGVLSPTSFTINRGEVLGFAGLQGSGRTDMANAIVGSRTAKRRGRIRTSRFHGLARNPHEALRAGILMLPANRKTQGILAVRPVAENIAIASLGGSLTRAGFVRMSLRRRLVGSLLQRFAVRPSNADLEMSALSGGNQQKALFARAAAAQAEILILDQPTAGVDVGATVELYDQVDKLTSSGVAVLLISDDLTELLRLSDSIMLMRGGVAGPARSVAEYDRASLLEAITGESAA
jgi:ABC-type sugar transport system ATPase subunit